LQHNQIGLWAASVATLQSPRLPNTLSAVDLQTASWPVSWLDVHHAHPAGRPRSITCVSYQGRWGRRTGTGFGILCLPPLSFPAGEDR
jgi:hypothetical protein